MNVQGGLRTIKGIQIMLIRTATEKQNYVSFDHVVLFEICTTSYSSNRQHVQLLAHVNCSHMNAILIYEAPTVHS